MNVKDQWKCGDCGRLHDFVADAIECCAPTAELVFCCGVCKAVFEGESDAESCCVAVDAENEPIVTAEMLEAAGQLRLPLPWPVPGVSV